ncbi:protein NLP3-like [Asparagus officinalis]|nr:protein NLP3-like [Asparagus officinalis]XP_020251835.1 protein NLP3-like [Asparagus officinalis]XP_020251836.1 protein NLP3-like [Asparagus officinalis]
MCEDDSDDYCFIRKRMTQALRYLKESAGQQILVQVWAPVKNGNKYVLTTSGQPFVLDPHSLGLHQYRTVSMTYVFSADGDGDGDLGLPGRVFRGKMPEWTPDVQFYSSKEYPRLVHARNFDVRGTLALPVFEPSGHSCVGVVELIMTSRKINYAPEVDKVCKALEAVNLKSYDISDIPSVQICNEGRQNAFAEILEILTTICEEHKLPIAQTWVPCRHRNVLTYGGGSQKSCSSFDGSCMGQVCMSTSDVAVYVIDPQMWGFRDACVEHHLQKGQGVAGRAFESRSSCFSRDITQFSKTEYPLVHYARLFNLAGSLAVCLQSVHTGNDDYILEFFLPPGCRDPVQQKVLLDSILNLMKQCFRNLRISVNEDIQEGKSPGFFDVSETGNREHEPGLALGQSCSTHVNANSPKDNPAQVENLVPNRAKAVNTERNYTESAPSLVNLSAKKPERKRGKAEKTISLEVLHRYFSGSLKDAAKALGVCPTTMKRICRQHGISRWPSRKINKVNRSLSKLKRVIESVQGAEGAFNLPSLSCQLPLAVSLDGCRHGGDGEPLSLQHAELDKDSLPHKSLQSDDQSNNKKAQQETIRAHADSNVEPDKDSSKTISSGEGSSEAATSQESCEEVNVTDSPNLNNGFNVNGFLGFSNPMPDASIEEPQPMLGRVLIEDSGSSKDLKNLFSSIVEGCHYENSVLYTNHEPSHPTEVQGLRTVTIKASYREDIVRFRLPGSAGMMELSEEVAKRLKLEVGTFDIRYLDEDQEWVMLSCDADLKECIEISRLSGLHIIRLSVHDVAPLLGSSCGSSAGQ